MEYPRVELFDSSYSCYYSNYSVGNCSESMFYNIIGNTSIIILITLSIILIGFLINKFIRYWKNRK